eukprot:7460738-Alexandrium_andersonii.AAC.1
MDSHPHDTFRSATFRLPPITGDAVRRSFEKAGDSAPGPDAWTNAELRGLPNIAYELIAIMYSLIEQGASWPRAVLESKSAFIPKGEAQDLHPLSHRVLTISSVIYRRWASLRLAQLSPWISMWQMPSMCGARGELSGDMASWALALQI